VMFCVSTSCDALYTKDDYIQAFSDFVSLTNEKCSMYTESDWKKSDKEFEKYVVVDYKRFKAQLSPLDETALEQLRTSYVYLRVNTQYKKTK
jgi:hypothetical protein